MIKRVGTKRFIKYCCGKILGGILSHKLENKINKADVISFDLYDTLVKRNVDRPEDVHVLVQREFFCRTGIEISDYLKLRVEAESKAREHCNKEEISLDDIYDALSEVSEEWKDRLKIIEKQIEMEICSPHQKMKAVYEKAVKDGKKVIITSDMYLDERIIQGILDRCGYALYEKLYLSSSYGLCKSRGSIYEIIKKDYKTYSGKILHIGDNVKGDYFVAKKKGINAVLIDGQPNYLRYWRKRSKNIKNCFLYQRIRCFINNNLDCGRDNASCIGVEILGPMLLGYCKWLYERIYLDKIDKIFFLSREGKILQDAFNILYPQCDIEQTYLYVSRQALVVPQLLDCATFDDMSDLIKRIAHIPLVNMIPTICMLNQDVFKEKLNNIGLDEKTRIDKVPVEKKERLYHIILDLGENYFKQQKEYIVEYLEKNDFAGNVAIVDIGWSGTMQQALQKYIENADTKLYGYYLGVRNIQSEDCYIGLTRSGYLFEPKKNEDYNLMTRFTAEIIEMLFLNTDGSVLKYDMVEENIAPFLDKSEYAGEEGNFIASMQSAALEFLNAIKTDGLFRKETIIPDDIIMNVYYQFAVRPRLATLKIFKSFQVLNGKVRKMIPEQGFLYYIVHPKRLRRDFGESSCKIFFLKRIFKIRFPYYEILKFSLLKWNGRRE